MGTLRAGHAPSDEELSPVFVQFVDCVWQMSQQMPRAFEFNGGYLAALLHFALACEHGTFLANCERQRVAHSLDERSRSVWDDLSHPKYAEIAASIVARRGSHSSSARFT